MKNIRIFLYENFHFLVVKFSVYLNRRVFVMQSPFLVLYPRYMTLIPIVVVRAVWHNRVLITYE